MRIGVDVGGTKVEAAAMDEAGEIHFRQRIATPRDYEAAIRAITGLIRDIETGTDQDCTVGLGIPGTISPATGVVKNAYNSPFNGHPMDKDIAAALGKPVRMMNDANCFALSEAIDGNAAGESLVFGVILGTGCGGGLIVDGKPLRGANAIAGEWGHNPLPWPDPSEMPGPPCSCGKRGCIETYLSGTGFAAAHNTAHGTALDAHEIVAQAQDGDADATASLRAYEERLARALASVINLFDPDVIVLGGGMSNVTSLYAAVPRMWGGWVFSDRVDTRLTPPRYGDSSGVRGAAWLWPADSAT